MADIANKKYFAIIADPVAQPTYPATWETAEFPVNPPSTNGGNLGGIGTPPKIAIWTSENTLGDSAASDDGSTFFIDSRTLRINSIDNLGTEASNYLVPDGSGNVRLRTAQQVKNDLGVITIPIPDGVVVIGTATQTVNDIEYGTDWVWRISEVEYSLSVADTISFPAAASGDVRIDLVVGDNTGNITRVAGTEVPSGDPVVAPSVPVNSVGLQEILVDDTGIDTITNFALANYVRYDIDDQGLSGVQKLNAIENIGIGDYFLRKNEDDEGTISLTTSDFKLTSTGQGNTSSFFRLFDSLGLELFRVNRRGDVTIRMSRVASRFTIYDFTNTINFEVNPNGQVFHLRSTDSDKSVRRDELYMNYSETNVTDGTINNLDIDAGTKLIKFTQADTLTGVVVGSGNEDRLLRIYSDGTTLTIKDEDANSTAVNRFDLGSDLVVSDKEIYSFIYTDSRWRRVL
jgi:hypothetical protein